jgi:hypothetical protein
MTGRQALGLAGLLSLILVVTLLGPAEKTLGSAARIIYLHGALVWVAIMVFGMAALLGAAGLLARRTWLHQWSRAAGQVALLFWAGYLPLSMWAAKATWGRVFLADPSFQRAFRILAVALIIQVVIWLVPHPAWAGSALNLLPAAFLVLQLYRTQQFMHPDAPIREAESALIQVYFYFLSALCALLAFAIGRWLLRRQVPGRPV